MKRQGSHHDLFRNLSQTEINSTIKFFIHTLKFSIASTTNPLLNNVSKQMRITIKRQRCLFHIEKDLAHKIKEEYRYKKLDLAKKLIKFTFFRTDDNLRKIGKYSEVILK